VERLRTAPQNGGVSRLDAQRGRVDRDIRTRLVDDADHAQRDPHAPNTDAGGQLAQRFDAADRIRERCDLFEALGHRFDHCAAQPEPVDRCGFQRGALRRGEILTVCLCKLGSGGPKEFRRMEQCRVLCSG